MRKRSKIILTIDFILVILAFFLLEYYGDKKTNIVSDVPEQSTVVKHQDETSSEDDTNPPVSVSPAVTVTPGPTSRPDTVITFTGDVLLTDYMISNYNREGIKGLIDNNLYNLLYNADINMINEEFPFSNRGTPMENKEYTFRASPEYVKVFQDMGVDIVTLANNHALDYGTDALLDTFTTLEEAGIKYVGAGKDLDRASQIQYFEVNGHRIAFIGASRVLPIVEWYATATRPGMLSTYDPTNTCKLITEAKKQADYVVVFVHWGVEYKERPETYQQNMGHQYIDSGADIVVGCHTHCLQGVEFYKDRPIVYSLGNFIFSRKTTDTAMIKLVIHGEGDLSLSMYPCKAEKGLTSMVTDPEEIRRFNEYIESISYDIRIDNDQILRKSD